MLKDASAEDLITAARVAAAGGAWFDPAVTGRLLAAYRRTVAPARQTARRLDELTEREHEVLRRLARGASNTEIAATLHVSEATVKSHVGSIFAKLGVRDRAAGGSAAAGLALAVARGASGSGC